MREVVGLAYFAICAAIAIWATRRTRTADDFFVAGRGVGLVPFAIAAMASTLSGFAFIGGTGLVYSVGMTAIFLILPAGGDQYARRLGAGEADASIGEREEADHRP